MMRSPVVGVITNPGEHRTSGKFPGPEKYIQQADVTALFVGIPQGQARLTAAMPNSALERDAAKEVAPLSFDVMYENQPSKRVEMPAISMFYGVIILEPISKPPQTRIHKGENRGLEIGS
jgi:hypothetical protein